MTWTLGLSVYAAIASTLVIYLRVSSARRERRWRDATRTMDAAISAAIHHLPPARPDRVIPIRMVDESGSISGLPMDLGFVDMDWDGRKRDAIRNLLTQARKSVHI